MSKLLKQLVQDKLEDKGINVNKITTESCTLNETKIKINNEITIVDKGSHYKLYTEDNNLNRNHYLSLTEAVGAIVRYLGVREGDILVSSKGDSTYRVIKHRMHNLYNLLDLETDRMLYHQNSSLNTLQEKISSGVFYVK